MELIQPIIVLLSVGILTTLIWLGIERVPEGSFACSSVSFDILQADNAIAIIQSWFPHDETELIEGAPYPICGRFSKSLFRNTGTGEVILDVFYKVPQKNPYLSFLPATRRKARVVMTMEEYARSLQMHYTWIGLSTVTSVFSPEYKVLKYLIDRTEKEFAVRGYPAYVPGAKAPRNPGLSPGQQARQVANQFLNVLGSGSSSSKNWGREYVSGKEPGRVYGAWPNPQDFSESVQNPVQNFNDNGLKLCNPVLNHLGIPKVASGMFASVYELENDTQRWAVRCFNSRLKDQNERYKAISSFILADDLPYTVDFHYLEDGIKCGGSWYPILKMTWVEGETLDQFVRQNLQCPSPLLMLRQKLQVMMEKLKANGVAHGDLQHGNILVNEGEVYLVDYDGFYVPELAGRQNNELGHPNYQHPGRRQEHFGPYIDNFAAWVIDLSLLALAEDPDLFKEFNGGDECLLFRKSDFSNPENSQLIRQLKRHESARIRIEIKRLLSFLELSLEEIPYLDTVEVQSLKLGAAQPS